MKKIHMAGFALLEVSYWSFHASFLAYLSAYLISKGVSNTMVSLLLSAFLLSAFAGSLFWGSYCDRRQTNRKPFFISAAATAVLMFVIYFLAESHLVLAVCYPLLGFFFQPQGANADAWLLAACRRAASVSVAQKFDSVSHNLRCVSGFTGLSLVAPGLNSSLYRNLTALVQISFAVFGLFSEYDDIDEVRSSFLVSGERTVNSQSKSGDGGLVSGVGVTQLRLSC